MSTKIVFRKQRREESTQKLPGVSVDQAVYEEICKIAKYTGTTQSEVIRRLVVEALEFVELSEGGTEDE